MIKLTFSEVETIRKSLRKIERSTGVWCAPVDEMIAGVISTLNRATSPMRGVFLSLHGEEEASPICIDLGTPPVPGTGIYIRRACAGMLEE